MIFYELLFECWKLKWNSKRSYCRRRCHCRSSCFVVFSFSSLILFGILSFYPLFSLHFSSNNVSLLIFFSFFEQKNMYSYRIFALRLRTEPPNSGVPLYFASHFIPQLFATTIFPRVQKYTFCGCWFVDDVCILTMYRCVCEYDFTSTRTYHAHVCVYVD